MAYDDCVCIANNDQEQTQCRSRLVSVHTFLPLQFALHLITGCTELALLSCRLSHASSWTLLTKESFKAVYPHEAVTGRFPDYSQCCKLVRYLAGRVTVLCAGTVESLGRCISTVTSYVHEGQEKLSITTAVICLPGTRNALQNTRQL